MTKYGHILYNDGNVLTTIELITAIKTVAFAIADLNLGKAAPAQNTLKLPRRM